MREYRVFIVLVALSILGVSEFTEDRVFAYPSGWSGYYSAVLRDANGTPIQVGSSVPYSPRQTCGYGGVNVNGTVINCHADMVTSFSLMSGSIYESDVAYATHDHGQGTTPYSVPYPMHGVGAAYHIQQGRNMPWGQAQRSFYETPDFVGSSGMYGLYSPTFNSQLAHPDASLSPFDITSFDFGHSRCSVCHAGGGSLEYDREGYRYDGGAGLFQTGFNPNPKSGDYFSYDPLSGTIVSRVPEWQNDGVAEIDCLLCHMAVDKDTGFRYSVLERNYALAEGKSPALAATMGLLGGGPADAFVNVSQRAGNGVNPDFTAWSWSDNYLVNTELNTNGVWFDGVLVSVPDKEACAQCHYADKGYLDNGPAGVPIGYTSLQKIMPPGTVDDSDKVGGGKNDTAWRLIVNRDSSRKSGESINDSLNADVHMDGGTNCSLCHYALGTPRDYNNDCLACHYDMWGYPAPPDATPVTPQRFPALTDASGKVIAPAVDVYRIDHQFAKGNNQPYSMNMDQLDNTVTCESCHITRSHPNAGSAPNPAAAHAGFPAFHFGKIDCRTCHIPELNFVSKQALVDFSSGPYQAGERGQVLSEPEGIHYRPLYLFRAAEPNGSGSVRIKPTATLTAAVWMDGASGKPVINRTVLDAARAVSAASGDGNGDGLYDWPLNRPQGGDTSLIVNSQAEIADMVSRLQTLGVATPVMYLGIDAYSVSHNVLPKTSQTFGKAILGSAAGGGCIMCHSSADPSSPNYSPLSVGFFDGIRTLFRQPADGGNGLVQTVINNGSGEPVKRVNVKFKARRVDGTSFLIDLSGDDGDTVANTLHQGQVLGYSAADISSYTNPGTGGVSKPMAYFVWTPDATMSYKVNFDAAGSACSNAPCAYTWDFGDGSPIGSGFTTSHTYGGGGSSTATLTITDSFGLRGTASQSVTPAAINLPPSVSSMVSINNYTVTLVDTSTDDNPLPSGVVTVNWNDGATSSGNAGGTFIHAYATAGTYNIIHTIRDAGGLTASGMITRTVPEKFAITVSTSPALPGAMMILKYNGVTKQILTTGTSGSVTFANMSPGTYTVQANRSGYAFDGSPGVGGNQNPVSVTVGPDSTVTFTHAP